MVNQVKFLARCLLALAFMCSMLFLIGHSVIQFFQGINEGKEIVSILFNSINTSFIALIIIGLQIKSFETARTDKARRKKVLLTCQLSHVLKSKEKNIRIKK
ncbi:MAG: hypothetical protein IH613_04735 [Desulfuromonadales bacterium]|nr:hypothetical protein [Desulfuromonadales bacterium]